MAIWMSFWFNPWLSLKDKQPMMSTISWAKPWYTSTSQKTSKNNSAIKQQKPTVMPEKQMMSYNVKINNPSKKYNWLEKEDEEYIDKTLSNIDIDETQKTLLREQAVKNFIESKQAKAFLADRENIRNEITAWKINLWDKKTNDATYRVSQFADLIRRQALSSWVKSVTSTDDNKIISSVLQQRPEIKDIFDKFVNWETSINNVARIMQWWAEIKWKFANWLADNVAPIIQRWVWAVLWEDAVESYKQNNKEKTFQDVATKDFWAAPSVIAWAATVPARQITNLLWWDTAKIDEVVDYLWIQKDWWFNAGKIASEIGVNAIETAAWMKLLNVWQLWTILAKNPSRYKYFAKPVLEAVWFTLAWSLTKWELGSWKEFATNIWINVLTSGLGNLLAGRSISKWVKTAAERVESSTIDDYIKSTKELKSDFSNPNPLNKLISKIDDAITKVDDDKWAIGQKLGSMRDKMKDIPYFIDDAVENINSAIKWNNIWASIIKWKNWVYKLSTKISKDSWKTSALQEIVNSLNETKSKSLWISNKLAALDKVNQDIIYTVKAQASWSPLWNALTKASKWFSETIENTMSWYWFTKWEYWKLANLKNSIKALSSDGKWAQKMLSKLTWPWAPEDVKEMLKQLKELWYTTDDLFSEAIVANEVMSRILSPSELQRAWETIYPSAPWLAEAFIKTAKWAVSKPLTAMREVWKSYVPKTKKDYVRWIKRMAQKRWTMKAIEKTDKKDTQSFN